MQPDMCLHPDLNKRMAIVYINKPCCTNKDRSTSILLSLHTWHMQPQQTMNPTKKYHATICNDTSRSIPTWPDPRQVKHHQTYACIIGVPNCTRIHIQTHHHSGGQQQHSHGFWRSLVMLVENLRGNRMWHELHATQACGMHVCMC
jgi:hypothetical protein